MTETFTPVPDQEFELPFHVSIRCYGKPEKVRHNIEEIICRIMHLAFGSERVRIESGDSVLLFDPVAHAGTEPKHIDPAVVRVPVLDVPLCVDFDVDLDHVCSQPGTGMVDGNWYCAKHIHGQSGVER